MKWLIKIPTPKNQRLNQVEVRIVAKYKRSYTCLQENPPIFPLDHPNILCYV